MQFKSCLMVILAKSMKENQPAITYRNLLEVRPLLIKLFFNTFGRTLFEETEFHALIL